MSRRNIGELCLLCEESPCRCGKAEKPKASRKRVAKPKAEPVEEEPKCNWCTAEERAAGMKCACLPDGKTYPKPESPVPSEPHPLDAPPPAKPSARDAMRALAARSRSNRPRASTTDTVTEDALRALAPILHRDELTKFRSILDRPRTTKVRAVAWTQRRVNHRAKDTA